MTYVEVANEQSTTGSVARRSDGSAVSWSSTFQFNAPDLEPGMVYSRVASNDVGVVAQGAYVAFASPLCLGSLGVPHLTATLPPRVGTVMNVVARGLPQGAATVLFGASNTTFGAAPLPMNLSRLGLTGCLLRVSPDAAVPVAGTGTSAAFAYSIPVTPALIGGRYYQQAVVPDPRRNPAGMVLSDAVAAVIGG